MQTIEASEVKFGGDRLNEDVETVSGVNEGELVENTELSLLDRGRRGQIVPVEKKAN